MRNFYKMNISLSEIQESFRANLILSQNFKEKCEEECTNYLNDNTIDVTDMNPLSIYYIISKLDEVKQIEFIKRNIKFIKEHDEDIFLYNMLSPEALSCFLSLNVLRKIKSIDDELFRKIISQNYEELTHGFSHDDYYVFYNEYYDDLLTVKNNEFIDGISCHNKCCYKDIDLGKINDVIYTQKNCNIEFINFILDRYKNKILTFNSGELLKFSCCIDDYNMFDKFISENNERFDALFDKLEEYSLIRYFNRLGTERTTIILSKFGSKILNHETINNIIKALDFEIVIKLYKEDKNLFANFKLETWIKVFSSHSTVNNEYKKILDDYEIEDIQSLFNTDFFTNSWGYINFNPLKYIEKKYRDNIETNGIFEIIDENTSVFSENYMKNLKEMQKLFKNKSINKNDEVYKKHLAIFILYLKTQNIVDNIEGENFSQINSLFYQIVNGQSLTILYEVSNINEITLYNRLRSLEFNVNEFTVSQLKHYNVKLHKQLFSKNIDKLNESKYKKLTLKLMLMIGFNNAKSLLELDSSISTLEHLVGNVCVKNISLDSNGVPMLNKRIINLLFDEKGNNKLKSMLLDKNNDIYKYFPRIFNEWEAIKLNGKDKNLNNVIDFLKSDTITLPPKYYRLNGLFKFIGCGKNIVDETIQLHDEILTRTSSTIPTVKGMKNGYSYEVLEIDDMEALTVGNKTDCCFTILGVGYACLRHAVTNKNGRVLVIKKDNQVVAHSWLWRNGNLLCLDNIEVAKLCKVIDFFDVYIEFVDKVINRSLEEEDFETCIKNITLGFNRLDKKINGIEKYPCLISKTLNLSDSSIDELPGNRKLFVESMPQPLEEVGYSDSKNFQYLLRGNGIFNFGDVQCNYQDKKIGKRKIRTL